MNKIFYLMITYLLIHSNFIWAMGRTQSPPLDTVQNVDLSRYLGKWYEIARLPQFFERNCVGVTAEYSLKPDGKIEVKNSCRNKTCDSPISQAIAMGRVAEPGNDSKLKISFFLGIEGDYWILDLEQNYQYAVVGTPNRKTFWILSRTPTLSDSIVNTLIAKFQTQGFALENIIRTQACE